MNPLRGHVLYHADNNIHHLLSGDIIVDTVGVFLHARETSAGNADSWVRINTNCLQLQYIPSHVGYWQLMT